MATGSVDVSDVDDLDHPSKRWISLAITVIAFLGAGVALLYQQASGRESAAGADARRKAIQALGIALVVRAEQDAALDVVDESLEARERTEAARSALESAAGLPPEAAGELERFTPVVEALAPLSELLGREGFRRQDDPSFPARFLLDKAFRADLAVFRHQAAVELVAWWST
ncbi:MAG: hypothetical protein ACRDKW_06425, partial [Actinomycetota bacterium]